MLNKSWIPGFLRVLLRMIPRHIPYRRDLRMRRTHRVGRWLTVFGAWCYLSPLFGIDCNRNGEEDADDIASFHSADCDGDGLPDECEFKPLGLGIFGEGPSVTDRTEDSVAADLSGDGKTDLVLGAVVPGGSSTLFLLLSSEGYTFAPAVEYDAGVGLKTIAADDWNGDGAIDVAATNSDAVLFFANQGDGTLAAPVRLPTVGEGELLDAADVNGDDRVDLVVGTSAERAIEIFVSLPGAGFERRGPFPFDARPEALDGVDVDLDGDHDIVVLSRSSATITILLNDGQGVLTVAETVAVPGRNPVEVLAEDLDGDAFPDLAVATLRGVAVLFGAADRTFPVHEFVEVSPSSLIAADINGDGAIDLVTGSSSSSLVSILVNSGERTFGPSAVNSSMKVTWRPETLAAGDFDGDGDADVAVTDKGSAAVNVLWNGESGVATSGLARTGGLIRVGFKPHGAVAGDFNGDGIPDVATSNGDGQNVSLLFGTGSGTFEEPTLESGRHYLFEGSGHLNHITAGDLDGDGDLEAIAVERGRAHVGILRNRGDGTFDPRISFPVGDGAYHVQGADLDGDGDIDLAVANAAANTASLLYNAGDGTFDESETLTVETQPESVALADLDDDGDIDVAVANRVAASISLFFRRDDATYAAPPSLPTLGEAISITTADFDVDGDTDLLSINATDAEIFFNSGGTDLERGGTFPLDVPIGQPPFSVTSADLNGDGFPDFATANFFARTISVVLGKGDGTFQLPYQLTSGQVTRAVVTGDFDGDGDLDALAANRVTQDAVVFLNDLQRPNVPRELPPRNCGAGGLFRRGDANGDGRVDLSDPLFTLDFIFREGAASPCAKAADVNDSGRLDVLDAIHTLEFLFRGGAPPAEPFATCGADPTEDRLRCDVPGC